MRANDRTTETPRLMRILFTLSGGRGHLDPLVPLATAARSRGHEVALSGRPWMSTKVEAFGFRSLPAGRDEGLVPQRLPLRPVDPAREAAELRDGFVRWIGRERAADLVGVVEAWRPDIVIWDETDFGAPVIAERIGLPHASLITLAAATYVTPELFAPALDELRGEHGLPPDPDVAMLTRHLVLAPIPPSYRDPAAPLPAATQFVRPVIAAPPPTVAPPPWLASLGRRPVVYVTLGTVFHVESGDLFGRVITGVRDLDVDVVVTVGDEIDPGEFGPQPANVRIERFVPQAFLLPRVDIVVSHGGSGTVIGSLAHGLPMVLVPMGADQPLNGARCAALGVARTLDPIAASPAEIADAVATVVREPGYAASARRLQAEVAALPGPERAMERIERLVRASPGA